MDFSILTYLKGIKTTSAIEALVAFLTMRENQSKEEFEYPISKLAEDIGVSRNTAKLAIAELIRLGIVRQINHDKRNGHAVFKIIVGGQDTDSQNFDSQKNDNQDEGNNYKKSVGARKKKEEDQGTDAVTDINNMDFNNLNLSTEDINSSSVVNINIYMTDKELGLLAKRVLREVFAPTQKQKLSPQWFAMQMRCMKDLLVEYRTDQVIAAIRYWTDINPPPAGVTSLKFLSWKKKNRDGSFQTNLMVGLNYYKQQYLANAHEEIQEEVERKRVEALGRERDEQERLEKEKKEVESMSSEQFVTGYFNKFSHIANKLKKESEV